MNDEVSYAAGIGASINRGSGSLAALTKGKGKGKKDKDKSVKKVKSTRTNAPKAEKPDKNIIDAVVVEPVKVKSERINAPAELTYKPQVLPTYGPGSEYNPNRGRQFNG